MEARLNEAKVAQLKSQLDAVRLELHQKEVMCEELMARESERLTHEELKKAGKHDELCQLTDVTFLGVLTVTYKLSVCLSDKSFVQHFDRVHFTR